MRHVQVMVVLLSVSSGGTAWAGPVVREASGPTPASIQAVVDQFRADLGPNNGVTPGSQPGGRREINWDGGGAGAPPLVEGPTVTRFVPRGATFATIGSGFETSGAPQAEFGDIEPSYSAIFAPFSPPRLFIALNTNVMDVTFSVPGNGTVRAGVNGFGVVFTDVDSPTSTRLQFFAPDGSLLLDRAVLAAAGDETQSFLGVSFNAGEVVGRVRIVTGNAALGPAADSPVDLVAMDDFIYGEPAPTDGLVISPQSGTTFQIGGFDLVVGVDAGTTPLTSGRLTFDGLDVTEGLIACFRPGLLRRGGETFSCQVPRGLLTEGEHVLRVDVTFADGSSRRNAVRWHVIGAPQY